MTYNHYKTQAIKDLKDYNCLKSSLVTLPKRIAIMQSCAPPSALGAVSASAAVSKDGGGNTANYLSHLEHLEKLLAANTAKIACIDTALAALSARERDLLSAYYINRQRNSVTNLAYKSYSDRSSIYRRAQKALEKYILAYFGECPL